MMKLPVSRCRLALLTFLSAGLLSLSPLAAAAFPDRPVKIIHAYPGATMDVALRYIADKLSAAWRQPVIVDTRAGASEIIAGDLVAKAAPDGYTLFAGADSNFSNNQYLFAKLPFDPERDLVPVTELFELPFALIVPGDLPAKTVKEFVALAKKGDLSYASSGPGGPNHLAMEGLNQSLGLKMLHVPYKVGPQVLQDLITNRVQALTAGVYTAVPYVPSGKLKVLAVSGQKRQTVLPDVPTFAEAGYPQVDIQTYVGLAAPKGTPPEVVDKISTDIRAILVSEEFLQKVGIPFGYTPVGSTAQQFGEALVKKRAQARTLIKTLNLKLD